MKKLILILFLFLIPLGVFAQGTDIAFRTWIENQIKILYQQVELLRQLLVIPQPQQKELVVVSTPTPTPTPTLTPTSISISTSTPDPLTTFKFFFYNPTTKQWINSQYVAKKPSANWYEVKEFGDTEPITAESLISLIESSNQSPAPTPAPTPVLTPTPTIKSSRMLDCYFFNGNDLLGYGITTLSKNFSLSIKCKNSFNDTAYLVYFRLAVHTSAEREVKIKNGYNEYTEIIPKNTTKEIILKQSLFVPPGLNSILTVNSRIIDVAANNGEISLAIMEIVFKKNNEQIILDNTPTFIFVSSPIPLSSQITFPTPTPTPYPYKPCSGQCPVQASL